MKNDNILVALMNKQGVMFVQDDEIKMIDNVEEHITRITEISENHHIYMDDIAFKAFNEKPLKDRFTRVFTSKKNFEKDANTKFRLHHDSELDNIVFTKSQFEPNTKIFFIGSSQFLERCSKYCNVLMLTVVDKLQHIDDNFVYVNTFSQKLKDEFSKRRDIKPEKLDQIIKAKKERMKALSGENITIAPNGIKIIDETYKQFVDDPLLNQNEYMFYEFSK